MVSNEPAPFGLQDTLGFTIEHGEASAVTRLVIDDRHLNPNGAVHGAIPFTLMDTAMGGAVMSVVDDGRICATIEMQTRFHRPVTGGVLTATAEVITAGRRVVHLRSETRNDDDKIVASATASFMVFEP